MSATIDRPTVVAVPDLPAPGSPRVMVCDDHRLFTDAMAATLPKRGWEICAVAVTVSTAIELVLEHQPDVLLLDVWFPAGSSLGSLEELTAASPGTAIVMLSAMAEVQTMADALKLGARGFACKTDGLASILDVVERVLAGEVVVQGSMVRSAPPGSAERLLEHLTPRELEVLRNLVEGRNMSIIAHRLGISYATARSHTQNVLMKLGVHSQVQAVAFAVAHGLRPEHDDGIDRHASYR